MSTSSTRASAACASDPARLIAVVVLPSPTPGLVTATTWRLAPFRSVSTRWRSTRYCSASNEAGLSRLTRCSPMRLARSTGGLVAVAGALKTDGATGSGAAGGGDAAGGAAGGGEPGGPASGRGEDAGVGRSASRSARSSASKNLLIGPGSASSARTEGGLCEVRAASSQEQVAHVAHEREKLRRFASEWRDGDSGEHRGGDGAQDPALPRRPDQRPGAPRRTPRRTRERLDGLVDDIDVDPPSLVGVADDEAVVAQDVHAARDPARVGGDSVLRPTAEEVEVARARHAETSLDIVADLRARQRGQTALQLDALLQLSERWARELRPQLRLAHEHDLEQLLRRRLEVGEHADLFECRRVEVLRFVENEHGVLAGAPTLEHEAPEGEESLGRRPRR